MTSSLCNSDCSFASALRRWSIQTDDLELESAGEEITLRPVRGTGPLTQEHGVWVFRIHGTPGQADQPMAASTTEEMLRQIREDRDLVNLGGDE